MTEAEILAREGERQSNPTAIRVEREAFLEAFKFAERARLPLAETLALAHRIVALVRDA